MSIESIGLISPDIVKAHKLEKLEFIETLLLFKGSFTRKDLKKEFDTAPAVATRDISSYKGLLAEHGLNPESVYLDGSTKEYKFDPDTFKPLFSRSSERAFSFLRMISSRDSFGDNENISIEAPTRLVKTNFETITSVSRAIFNNEGIEISYFSGQSGEGTRTLFPHAFFDGGHQWYIRAYCALRNEFRSFAISRISHCKNLALNATPKMNSRNDHQWNKILNLELSAHPTLVSQPQVIEFQYGMIDGVKKITCRASSAGYWLNFWGVDCSSDASLKDKRHQLWLKNPQALYDVETSILAPGYKQA
ncbi:MAG: WYL domain-containing protein [Oceanospirillaceae bacterium]|nr:WYL domain-containing protein [Oceanospirillaceae bacterium]